MAPNGDNVAFAVDAAISQVLDAQLSAGTLYTLEVEVGRPSIASNPFYKVQLWADDEESIGHQYRVAWNPEPEPDMYLDDREDLGLGQQLVRALQDQARFYGDLAEEVESVIVWA